MVYREAKELLKRHIMKKTFIEMKLFQVKPGRLEQFEAKIEEMSANQLKCEGCISLKYFKRFYHRSRKNTPASSSGEMNSGEGTVVD